MTPDNPNLDAWETNISPSGGSGRQRRRRLDGDSTVDVSDDDGLYYDTYFFNVTNPEAVMDGAKPALQQQGPYANEEFYQKFDVEWSDDQEQVTYNTQKYYVPRPDRSGPGLSTEDELTLVYPTVIGFQFLLDQIDANQTELVQTAIDQELADVYAQVEDGLAKAKAEIDKRHVISKSKKKILDKQIDDISAGITDMYGELTTFIAESNPVDLLLKVILGKSDNGISPFFKVKPGPGYFGWLNDTVLLEVQAILDQVEAKTNATIPWSSAVPGAVANYTSIADARRRKGRDTMQTGKNDISEAGNLVSSEGMISIHGCVDAMASQNTSDYKEGFEFPACEIYDASWNESTAEAKGYALAWATPEANAVPGGSGEIFHPHVSDDLTNVFISDIYRGANLEHTEDIDWYGVELYRLVIRHEDMLNSTEYPPNAAYYSNGPMGLLNMTAATGAPAFGSYPHFLNSDPRLLDAVEGLDPSNAAHLTYLDVEPNTGLLACARKQLQTNYFLTNQTFPTTTHDFKGQVHELCENISTLLVELKQDPLPCDDLTRADQMFDILEQPAGWKAHDGGLQGGTYFPYAWSSEYMTLSQQDAAQVKSTVYAVQDLETASFQWGLGASVVFALTTCYLIVRRIAASESLTSILCGGQGKFRARAEKNEKTDSFSGLYGHGPSDIQSPLISNEGEIRESQF